MASPYDATLRAHLPVTVYMWYHDNARAVDELVRRVLGFCSFTQARSNMRLAYNNEHAIVNTVRYLHACEMGALLGAPTPAPSGH
jgi:hypothetical protein